MPNVHTFHLVLDINGNSVGADAPIDLLCPNGVQAKAIGTGIYDVSQVPPVEVQQQGANTKILVKVWNCDNTAFELLDVEYKDVLNAMEYPCSFCNPVDDESPCEDPQKVGIIEIWNGAGILGYKDLPTAIAFLTTWLSNPPTKVWFDGTYYDTIYFEVPQGTTANAGFLANSPAFIVDNYGIIEGYGDGSFASNTGNNIIKNSFTFPNVQTFGDGCFVLSSGDNRIDNGIFGNDCFSNSTGNNRVLDGVFQNYAFAGSGGNNIMKNCTFEDFAFVKSFGHNRLGDCQFKRFGFQHSDGNNILGICTFEDSAFFESTGNNFIQDFTGFWDCFVNSSGNNVINFANATDTFFRNCSGHNRLGYVNCGNKFMQDTTGDNVINDLDCKHNCFVNCPNATQINTIGNLIQADQNFGSNYQGTMIIKGNLGASDGADLNSGLTFFIAGSNARLVVDKNKLFSNGGSIEGDIQNAMANGAQVHFILN